MAQQQNNKRAALMLIPSKYSLPKYLNNSVARERLHSRLEQRVLKQRLLEP
ncbi:MAG: hypothetical protein V7739_16440 [Motiliproteus sp.]